MRTVFFHLFFWLWATVAVQGQNTAPAASIIPEPAEMIPAEGQFVLSRTTRIYPADKEAEKSARYLIEYIDRHFGYELSLAKKDTGEDLIVLSDRKNGEIAGGYRLQVSPKSIRIEGNDGSGVFYGVQTLIQLLPTRSGIVPVIEAVTINDYPRFAYRGMHLDVVRHFFPVEYVKRYIDYLALHKMNYFHWHLTDDQAWRIEMKSHPELTQRGSSREGEIVGLYPGTYRERPYEGYYTQEQVREIIRYAAQRYITVIPEIDIPGHCMAVLAVHPEYSTEPELTHKTAQTWGIYNKFNNVLAPTPQVFAFLSEVFDELCELFPSQYIHVGGDECAKKWWKQSRVAQQFIKDQGLKDEDELQSYFIRYVADVIARKGKTAVGWNEILEGGLAPDAVVMSWQGTQGGITAARSGHRVIMTPSGFSYYNNRQSHNQHQITHQGYLPLDKVYRYRIIPDELTEEQARNIIGAQACLWTEYFPTTGKVETALFPRISALAENVWSQPEKKDWERFLHKMSDQFERYDLWGVRFSDDFFRMYDVPHYDPTAR